MNPRRPTPCCATGCAPILQRGASVVRRGVVRIVLSLALAGAAGVESRWADAQAPAPAAGRSDAAVTARPPLGYIDEPIAETVVADTIRLTGWAVHGSGIDRVEIVIDGHAYPAEYGTPRADVERVHPAYPDAARSGFAFETDIIRHDLQRHEVTVVAVGRDGSRHTIGRRSAVPPAALHEWSALLDRAGLSSAPPFEVVMMTSGMAMGGAREIETEYRALESRTHRVGMSVPVLYMRTTRGAAGDWTFDPAFDLGRKCGERPVADDNLQGVIATALERRIPVQFILNGGIWGDASCESREWDLTDHLQLDDANVQWSQQDRTFPDDYLKNLAGSTTSPLLARSLTYHVHARTVREYKRRNLQAAARIVAQFAREHPELFIGVVLDSDTYMNPFFPEGHVFDYNPGMLRQFREWLRGTGPYAGDVRDGAPDLRSYRRARVLTLPEVNALARRHWRSWSEVQPPRRLPGLAGFPPEPGEAPVWKDPWWHEWDRFRKHIVDLHYDELSRWTHDVGIPGERIYSAQGFMRPEPGFAPLALTVSSVGQNYDSAGVSVEGAVPRYGRLGAVIYGRAARNDMPMESGRSLFAEFARLSPGWGVVEFNPTDLKQPKALPTYADAYHSLRDMFNYDASEVSVMAWNGMNGIYSDRPDYVPYTSWRNTAGDTALRDFLVSHADVPRGAQLWTFGSAAHADDDGWTAVAGTAVAGKGYLELGAKTSSPVDAPHSFTTTLLSPDDLVVRPTRIARVELKPAPGTEIVHAILRARTAPQAPWRDVGRSEGPTLQLAWPAEWQHTRRIVQRLQLELTLRTSGGRARLRRIALYPACAAIVCRINATR